MELRTSLAAIEHVMSNVKPNTVLIATPAMTPNVQMSSVSFQSMDGAFYTIHWSITPMNSVHLERTGAVEKLDNTSGFAPLDRHFRRSFLTFFAF